jgi:ABC-type Fe3+ transport system substrate-binding protein
MIARLAAFILLALPAFADPAPEATKAFGAPTAQRLLRVQSTTDIDLIAPVLNAFAGLHPNLRIDYQQWGSNELYRVSAQACAGQGPVADFVFSSAVDLQVRLVNDGCAQAYASAPTRALPLAANWRDELFGLTREPAVLVYNRALVPPSEAPQSRFDLLDLLRREDGRYDGKVATYDIEASGLGYLFAFADADQATTFGSLLEGFGRAHSVATCCSAEIITGVEEGRWLIAYNVLGSNALARAAVNPNLAVVAPQDYTLILQRSGLIPKGAANPADAGALIDFLLSDLGRRLLAETHLIVDPAKINPDDPSAPLSKDDATMLRPIPLSPILLVGNDRHRRAAFIDLWRKTFPRP